MKSDKSQLTPIEWLDKRKQLLAHKHQRRLQSMTQEALQSSHKAQLFWLKPALAASFSAVLLAGILYWQEDDNLTQPFNNDLPTWVMDTDVPLGLIENLEFYDWLAQQNNLKQTKRKTPITVAANRLDQYRFSQRRATRNFAKRFPRADAYFGDIQR